MKSFSTYSEIIEFLPENTLRFQDLEVGTIFRWVDRSFIFGNGFSPLHIKCNSDTALNIDQKTEHRLVHKEFPVIIYDVTLHEVRQ